MNKIACVTGRVTQGVVGLRGLILSAAVLAALIINTGTGLAGSPYGVGGYLERPYEPNDDDPQAYSTDANQQQRARRPGQQQQPTQSPAVTGATPGGTPYSVSPYQQPGYGDQRRRPASEQSSPQGSGAAQQQQQPAATTAPPPR